MTKQEKILREAIRREIKKNSKSLTKSVKNLPRPSGISKK